MEIDFFPFITIEGVLLREFRAQRVDILDHTAVIFTSRTAVDHFFRLSEEGRIAIPEVMKYFCISEAIANYLQKYIVYRKRKIFFGESTFAQLIEVMSKHKELKYIVPLCEPHKAEIPEMLTKAGIKFSKVILARTVASDLSNINLSHYDIAVFYSPAEIKALTENFPKAQRAKFFLATFGQTTAQAVHAAGEDVDLMVPTPQYPSMTMALDSFINSVESGQSIEDFALRCPATKSTSSYSTAATLRKGGSTTTPINAK